MILTGWLLVFCVVLVILRNESCERRSIARYNKAFERILKERNQM
jgi:hypothetical protein